MSTHCCALRHVQVCWSLFSSAHNLLIYSCRNHCWGFAPVFFLTIKSFLWQLSQYSKELCAVLMPSGHDTHLRLSTVTSVLPVCHFLNLARSDSPASSASTMRDLDSGEKWCRGGCHSNSSSPVCLCNLILFIEFFSLSEQLHGNNSACLTAKGTDLNRNWSQKGKKSQRSSSYSVNYSVWPKVSIVGAIQTL